MSDDNDKSGEKLEDGEWEALQKAKMSETSDKDPRKEDTEDSSDE